MRQLLSRRWVIIWLTIENARRSSRSSGSVPSACASASISSINLRKSLNIPRRLERDQFSLGFLDGAELEAQNCATAEGIAELLERLRIGGVLTALDPRHR